MWTWNLKSSRTHLQGRTKQFWKVGRGKDLMAVCFGRLQRVSRTRGATSSVCFESPENTNLFEESSEGRTGEETKKLAKELIQGS